MKTNPLTRSERAGPRRAVALALAAALALLTAGAAGAAAPDSAAPASPATAAGRPADVPASPGYSARASLAAADADLAAGRTGAALVELERARLLAPRSAVVAGHLAQARDLAHLPPVQTGPVLRASRWLSGSEWSRVALGGLIMGATGVILLSWGSTGRKRAASLVMAGLAVAAWGLFAAVKVTPSPGDAVVVVADAVVRIAPFTGAEPAFSLQEGAPVTLARAHGAYVLVAAGQGVGWLPRASVETILPGSLDALEQHR